MSWLLSPKDLAPSLSKHRRPELTIRGIDQILLIYAYWVRRDCLSARCYCCEATRLRSRLISVAHMISLGFLRQKPSSFEIIVDVCISPHLPWFQVIEIKALSIRKNVTFYHQSGIDVEEKILFHVESHVFTGEESESKLPWLKPICFSEYLKQFLELWDTLKAFRMWKDFGNSLEMVRILFENPPWNARGSNIPLFCLHYPHAGECYNFFFSCFRNFIYHMVRYWLIYRCGKIKRYNACETSPKFSGENFGHLRCKRQ